MKPRCNRHRPFFRQSRSTHYYSSQTRIRLRINTEVTERDPRGGIPGGHLGRINTRPNGRKTAANRPKKVAEGALGTIGMAGRPGGVTLGGNWDGRASESLFYHRSFSPFSFSSSFIFFFLFPIPGQTSRGSERSHHRQRTRGGREARLRRRPPHRRRSPKETRRGDRPNFQASNT